MISINDLKDLTRKELAVCLVVYGLGAITGGTFLGYLYENFRVPNQKDRISQVLFENGRLKEEGEKMAEQEKHLREELKVAQGQIKKLSDQVETLKFNVAQAPKPGFDDLQLIENSDNSQQDVSSSALRQNTDADKDVDGISNDMSDQKLASQSHFGLSESQHLPASKRRTRAFQGPSQAVETCAGARKVIVSIEPESALASRQIVLIDGAPFENDIELTNTCKVIGVKLQNEFDRKSRGELLVEYIER